MVAFDDVWQRRVYLTIGADVQPAISDADRAAARDAAPRAAVAAQPAALSGGERYGIVGGRRRIEAGASGSGSSSGRRFASSRATWRQRWRTKSTP